MIASDCQCDGEGSLAGRHCDPSYLQPARDESSTGHIVMVSGSLLLPPNWIRAGERCALLCSAHCLKAGFQGGFPYPRG